ncbi:DNA polymerase III subunit delta' [Methyloradius palustris]|uniref:DNA polymerase III subunit delta n=1 Tax=Methyloradius palustris TaxID=2778876 RepID=A0A8D5GB79_9PROT|nr:DNA polymerase III subunit delta' [Methyloradius palustris]BCM25066.1 DNA polymerase III subunit delta' [Methyloradius palustris]
MTPESLYPWQSALWQQLAASRNKLPHALLLKGQAGLGKMDFALALSQALLCETPKPDGHACGHCASCGWFLQGNHPDYRLLTPEQAADDEDAPAAKTTKTKKTQILINQVRELGSFFSLSSHRGSGLRVVLIHPAEALNDASANSLLKMLEEPPADVIFLLVSHQPQRLMATITSRCHKIDMPSPSHEEAVTWLTAQGIKEPTAVLDYAGGSPLAAKNSVEEGIRQLPEILQMLAKGEKTDAFALATTCVSLGMETAVVAIQKWTYDLLSCKLTDQVRYHGSHRTALQALAKSVNLGLLLDFNKKMDEARKAANHPLNSELQLESIFLLYTQLFSTQPLLNKARH